MIMNDIDRVFKQVQICETFEHCGDIVRSLVCILMKQHGVHGGKIPLENPWKWHFRDSKFQNVPRCLGPQELVPLVRVPKPHTIHYQPATQKRFDSPDNVRSYPLILPLKCLRPFISTGQTDNMDFFHNIINCSLKIACNTFSPKSRRVWSSPHKRPPVFQLLLAISSCKQPQTLQILGG